MLEIVVTDVQTGRSFSDYFQDHDPTVECLKRGVLSILEVPLESQILVCNDRILNMDDKTLQEYDINGDSLNIEVFRKKPPHEELDVTFLFAGYKYNVAMKASMTGFDTKEIFHVYGGGLPNHRQNLFCLSAAIDDEDELRDFAIEDEIVIHVAEVFLDSAQTLTVKVSLPYHTLTCEIESHDTLHTLFGVVHRHLLNSEDIDIREQGEWVFTYDGEELDPLLIAEDLAIDGDGQLTLEFAG